MARKREITLIELNRIAEYPPVQTLIKILLKKGYKVNFIGREVSNISDDIKCNDSFCPIETSLYRQTSSVYKKIINRLHIIRTARKSLKKCMVTSEILWTTSMFTTSIVGKQAANYKMVLQLMELAENGYRFGKHFKIPIKKYAQSAWKTVVPEINRAYIQKTWWDLEKTPAVLPNKPFSLDCGELSQDVMNAISVMKNETRKIILYLGGIWKDRNFEQYAKTIHKMDGYVLYIVGKTFSGEGQALLDKLKRDYNVVYLGGFNPPVHLALVQHSRIGLLPYNPTHSSLHSCLNALYCAPNKIWEYAGFGVPMVGSDVLGLKLPFEQWNIGRCCDLNDEASIIKAIEEVDRNHDEMSKNCYKFYDSVDLEKIVSEILEDEN